MAIKLKPKRLASYDISPRYVALLCASVIAGVVLLLLLLLPGLFRFTFSLPTVIITVAIVFVVSYLFILNFIEVFIYSKIKLIYKTIHSLKTQKSEQFEFNTSKDFLRQVNKEVIDWANTKKDEIRELKERESFRRDFIGNLSHELKTPIFSIQGYLLTLLEGGMNDARINRSFLERAARSVERMVTLVEDLESIAQLESGSLQLDIAQFDLVAVARDVMESLEIKADNRGVTLKFNKNYERPIKVMGDAHRIAQVLTNLMVNAINYSRDEGSEVEVRFFDMDEHILTEVADNGIGIDPENLPRLFERFYRVDKSRSRHVGGSGLGLSICKHIIDAHNETLNVRSTRGLGSTFSFTLKKK